MVFTWPRLRRRPLLRRIGMKPPHLQHCMWLSGMVSSCSGLGLLRKCRHTSGAALGKGRLRMEGAAGWAKEKDEKGTPNQLHCYVLLGVACVPRLFSCAFLRDGAYPLSGGTISTPIMLVTATAGMRALRQAPLLVLLGSGNRAKGGRASRWLRRCRAQGLRPCSAPIRRAWRCH